jgi:hypothetical protein
MMKLFARIVELPYNRLIPTPVKVIAENGKGPYPDME